MKRICKHVMCPNIASNPNGYCDQHQAEAPAKQTGWRQGAKGTETGRRGYDSSWQSYSRRYLKDHPLCCLCGSRATVTDHWLIPAPIMLEKFGRFILEDRYYRPLCRKCNEQKGRTRDKEVIAEYRRTQLGGTAR